MSEQQSPGPGDMKAPEGALAYGRVIEELRQAAPASAKAAAAFRQALPRLLVFANEKVGLEDRFVCAGQGCKKSALIEQCNRDFGELLMAVYEFSLYDLLPDEFMNMATMLESRGLAAEALAGVLNAWAMGIRCTVAYPEADELAWPVTLLHRQLPALHAKREAALPELDEHGQRFFDYVVQKNRKFAAETVLSHIREGASLEHVYTTMLLPVLDHIRRLWRQNNISVADEYVATDICRYVMFRVMDSIFGERRYPFKALVTCAPGERDSLSSEIFANYIEIRGWSVYFIGQSTGDEDILHAAQKNRPQVCVVSAATIAGLPSAKGLLQRLRQTMPGLKLAAEGRAVQAARQQFQGLADGLVSGLEQGHTHMLALVMPDA